MYKRQTKDNDDNFLFALQIREGELIRIEKIQDEGIELRDFFGITTRGYIYKRANFAEIYTLKKSLKQKFKDAQLRNKRLETDRKAIATALICALPPILPGFMRIASTKSATATA